MNAILYNGLVYPQYRVRRRPTIVVISKNRITAVDGDLRAIRSEFPRHRMIDLSGRAVLPGFVDSHTHFYYWAKTLDTVHLEGIADFDRALREIKKSAEKRERDEWVIGDGWSADRWESHHLPSAQELDRVTGGRPSALYSKDQHMLWVNSRALQLAGIGRDYPDPSGGKIDRDIDTGEPTGILREKPAYDPVIALFGRPGRTKANRFWRQAAKIAYRRGVTGFHSVDDDEETWEFLTQRHSEGKLGFRVHYYFPVRQLDELIEKRYYSGLGDETLRVGGVKIFSDGSLGSRSALMKRAYLNDTDNHGVEVTGRDELVRLIGKASRQNLACAVHAIGDQAVANVISAFEKAGRGKELRHRIEHLQVIDRRDIGRLEKIGVVVSMQPSHCPSDRQLVRRYWGKRGRNAFIFRTLLKRKIRLTFGSDCPIEPLDPLGGIHAAVNRNGFGERGLRFYPNERLTVNAAAYGFTAAPAFTAGRENFSGRIAPGYQADLVILDDNIFDMPLSQIYRARVAATIFDGKLVYRSTGFNGS